MHSINWKKVQNQTQYGAAIASFAMNSLLTMLILTKSPKKLGAYKYLMIGVSIFQIFFSVMDVAITPIFHSHGSSCVIFVDLRETIFSRETALVFDAIYCGCFGFSMALFGINFIYRYLVASGSKLLVEFNNWKVVTWLIIPLIYGIVWGLTSYMFCGPNEAANKYIKNEILVTYDIEVENFTFLSIYLYPLDENGQARVSIRSALSLGIFLTEIMTSLFTIFYFATKCFLLFNSLFQLTSFSAHHLGLQSQLFYALLTQTLIPVLLMHLPVSAMFLFTSLDWELGMGCGVVSIATALYPAVDPLPTLLIVRNYRKGLYEYYSKVRNLIFRQSQ